MKSDETFRFGRLVHHPSASRTFEKDHASSISLAFSSSCLHFGPINPLVLGQLDLPLGATWSPNLSGRGCYEKSVAFEEKTWLKSAEKLDLFSEM